MRPHYFGDNLDFRFVIVCFEPRKTGAAVCTNVGCCPVMALVCAEAITQSEPSLPCKR